MSVFKQTTSEFFKNSSDQNSSCNCPEQQLPLLLSQDGRGMSNILGGQENDF